MAKPVKSQESLWPAWSRFFLMLLLILLIDTSWLWIMTKLHFIAAPENPGKNLTSTTAAAEANLLIGCLLGAGLNAGLMAWALSQRHWGEAMASLIGVLWIAGGSFCLYLVMLFGYTLVAALNSTSGAGQ